MFPLCKHKAPYEDYSIYVANFFGDQNVSFLNNDITLWDSLVDIPFRTFGVDVSMSVCVNAQNCYIVI